MSVSPITSDTQVKFQHKHETEEEARAQARSDYPRRHVAIIESQGAFYLEDGDSLFLRNFERQVYAGVGRGA